MFFIILIGIIIVDNIAIIIFIHFLYVTFTLLL